MYLSPAQSKVHIIKGMNAGKTDINTFHLYYDIVFGHLILLLPGSPEQECTGLLPFLSGNYSETEVSE
jgi:hypothetical protein